MLLQLQIQQLTSSEACHGRTHKLLIVSRCHFTGPFCTMILSATRDIPTGHTFCSTDSEGRDSSVRVVRHFHKQVPDVHLPLKARSFCTPAWPIF